MLEKMRLKVLDMYGTFVKRDYPDMYKQSDQQDLGGTCPLDGAKILININMIF